MASFFSRRLFELTVLPAMVILPVLTIIQLQHRLVHSEPAVVHAPAKAIPDFNGFPYLQLPKDSFRPEHAVENFTRLVAEDEVKHGHLHPVTLVQRNNLANALLSDGRYLEAEAKQRELLRDMEISLAPQHPDTFRCRFNLALNLRMQGKMPEARLEMEKVYQGWKEVLGEGHPRTQSALLVLEKLSN